MHPFAMRTIGLYLTILGLLSIIFYGMGIEAGIFKWIDTWGTSVGLLIRALLIFLGGWMLTMTKSRKKSDNDFEEWDEMNSHKDK